MSGETGTDPRGDLQWGTTGGLLAAARRRTPDAEALVDGGLRLTYRQLDDAVFEVARALIAIGIQPGDRIAVWGPNSAEWVIAAFGLQRAGAVLVPLNTRFLGEEALFVLRKSRARLLFTVTDFLARDYPASLAAAGDGYSDNRPIAALPELSRIVLLSDVPSPWCETWPDFLAHADDARSEDVTERSAGVGPDDLSDILFTSGTTGQPKGAMSTHGQTLRAFAVWCQVIGLREGDRYLIVNPFFHGFGYKAGWLAAVMVGATILPARTLDVPAVLDLVARERITVLPGTPTLYQTMLEHPAFDRGSVTTLRLAVTGAANVPTALLYRIRDQLGFQDMVTGYGLTESSAIVSMCRHDDPLDVIATTAGRALPGLELRVVDADGRPVPNGTEGELVVRGYTVMQGYYDEPEETAATIDADGWLHTGDVGTLDDDGLVRITDRLKDMFIVGGFNAYPAEIEQIISRNERVAQVAVIGIPDERLGEVGAAFVVPRSGADLTPEAVIAFCSETMANYKVPRRAVIVASLPLNASGKVLKNVLRDQIRSIQNDAS